MPDLFGMFGSIFNWWFLFVIAFMVVAIVWGAISHDKRKREWSRWVRARNWQFIETWSDMVGPFQGGPFGRGSDRKASFGYRGSFDGLEVCGFNYQYDTGSGDSETTHHYHVDLVRIPGAQFPQLEISPDGITKQLFGRDTTFENAEFNRRWYVSGSSPRFTHDVFHPRMMTFFLGPLPTFSTLWFERDAILIARPGQSRIDGVDPYLRLLSMVARQVQPFTLKELGCQRPEISDCGPGISAEEQQRRIAQFIAEEERKR